MLWHKSWLDTRWRFLLGLALLMLLAVGTVLGYPQVVKLRPLVQTIDTGSAMGRLITEAADVTSDYRGHVWWQWFRQNLAQMGTLFAALLGSGGLLAPSGPALFTLSLPISRSHIIGARAAAGLAQLLLLAVLPSLAIPLLSPAIGESYRLGDALVHGVCMFMGTAVFFSLALLLSTVFSDVWRPLLIACFVAIVLWVAELLVRDLSRAGIFTAMTGELYFRRGTVPWPGLLAAVIASASMLYAASRNYARHDF